MGKTIKLFEQRKDESNVIENFNMKNDTNWRGREKGRGRGDTVAQNDPCMVIRSQPKYSQ